MQPRVTIWCWHFAYNFSSSLSKSVLKHQMVIATSHLLGHHFDKRTNSRTFNDPSMTQQKIFWHQWMMCDSAEGKRNQFHHTRRAFTLPKPKQRQKISTKNTLSKQSTVKINTAKNHFNQENYVSHPVSLPLALPRLPPKGYMRLFRQFYPSLLLAFAWFVTGFSDDFLALHIHLPQIHHYWHNNDCDLHHSKSPPSLERDRGYGC